MTLGIVWPACQAAAEQRLLQERIASDRPGRAHYAQARIEAAGLILERDSLGVVPVYYGFTGDGTLCFSSEVKPLLDLTRDVRELLPNHYLRNGVSTSHCEVPHHQAAEGSLSLIVTTLRDMLSDAVTCRLHDTVAGCWFSGGLDSGVIAALARPHVAELHTFSVGLKDSSDLPYAREGAAFLNARHHEVTTTVEELLGIMPEVVTALESFDALLVRSSLTNYLVAKVAADYVPAVFSGEAGDELFAGYDYLKEIPKGKLAKELDAIVHSLHNTAFQRVDRCAAAHGLVVHVPFADAAVVDYALRIPVRYKIVRRVEKWILRQAMEGLLPRRILERPKAKFWEGTGLGAQIAAHADNTVSNAAFLAERTLPNGWILNTKEEVLYYRAFRDRLGDLGDLSWMGRTKGAPIQ